MYVFANFKVFRPNRKVELHFYIDFGALLYSGRRNYTRNLNISAHIHMYIFTYLYIFQIFKIPHTKLQLYANNFSNFIKRSLFALRRECKSDTVCSYIPYSYICLTQYLLHSAHECFHLLPVSLIKKFVKAQRLSISTDDDESKRFQMNLLEF